MGGWIGKHQKKRTILIESVARDAFAIKRAGEECLNRFTGIVFQKTGTGSREVWVFNAGRFY